MFAHALHRSCMATVMHTDFKIEKLSMCLQRTTLIPNHNIGGVPGIKSHIHTIFPKLSTAMVTL